MVPLEITFSGISAYYFLIITSGARMFFHSLETAIFWFSRVSGVHPHTLVLPGRHGIANFLIFQLLLIIT